MYEPLGNLIIQYSTTSNLNAYERVRAQNSNYVNHLKDHLGEDMPLQKILDIVIRGTNFFPLFRFGYQFIAYL